LLPLAYGGEVKNCKAPLLNTTSIGKCRHKKSLGKNTDFSMPNTGSDTVVLTGGICQDIDHGLKSAVLHEEHPWNVSVLLTAHLSKLVKLFSELRQ
jgi:hypothetical protein